MRGILLTILLLLLIPMALSVSGPIPANGKSYYVVTSTDPTEDTGAEVCAKVGLVCKGYTDTVAAVCHSRYPTAFVSSSNSGDSSTVYCDGSPQNGLCAGKTNTCHSCPTCTRSADCQTPIGGLYREMYVECAAPTQAQACGIHVQAKTAQDFLNQVGGLNQQLQSCPQAVPSGASTLLGNGIIQVDVAMNSGTKRSVYLTIAKKQITGISATSPGACSKKVQTAENSLDSVMNSRDRLTAVLNQIGNGKISVSGCSFWQNLGLFFINPIAQPILRNTAPTLPPPPPAPNCGQVGEQCNNRACFSGVCGSQRTQNSYGQWGNWNYECIDVAQYDALCVGRGNSPPAWSCITGICR